MNAPTTSQQFPFSLRVVGHSDAIRISHIAGREWLGRPYKLDVGIIDQGPSGLADYLGQSVRLELLVGDSVSRAGGTLSPARLGEVWAHLQHFRTTPREKVLAQLGYDKDSFASENIKTVGDLTRALDQGDITTLLRVTHAYELTDRRLRSRQPRLEAIAVNRTLEPVLTERKVVAPASMVPLPKVESQVASSAQAMAKPSYLQEVRKVRATDRLSSTSI